MDQGAKGWVFNTARKNFWRVQSFYELDDLIQDGYWHFERVKNKYANVKEPKHLMALFKRCYINHIHDLSKKHTNAAGCITESRMSVPIAALPIITHPDTSAQIAGMTPVLRRLLHLLATDPRVQSIPRRRTDRSRATTNEFFCKLLGLDPTIHNIHTLLLEALDTHKGPAVC